jgi:hypothetical protein
MVIGQIAFIRSRRCGPDMNASASELGLDHQPRVDLVVGENRNPLLVLVRQSEIVRSAVASRATAASV